MLNELNQILENAKGHTIGLFKNAGDKTFSEDPEFIFSAVNLSHETKERTLKLFDKHNPDSGIIINLTDFIGADTATSQFWIGEDGYAVVAYS